MNTLDSIYLSRNIAAAVDSFLEFYDVPLVMIRHIGNVSGGGGDIVSFIEKVGYDSFTRALLRSLQDRNIHIEVTAVYCDNNPSLDIHVDEMVDDEIVNIVKNKADATLVEIHIVFYKKPYDGRYADVSIQDLYHKFPDKRVVKFLTEEDA
ncbi:hypothetical protein [Alishewanella phage vB_AspM_Slicko01]|nr:hypothetical protein [Alishewanella phage vB_AspM_Slicko01]